MNLYTITIIMQICKQQNSTDLKLEAAEQAPLPKSLSAHIIIRQATAISIIKGRFYYIIYTQICQ